MKLSLDFRTTLGIAACGLYAWRVQDPKGAYAAFYDATDWLTTAVSNLFVSDGAVTGFLRNTFNLILVDQVEGFLIGIAFVTVLAAILWPVKAGGRLAVRGAKRALRRKEKPFVYPAQTAAEPEPLVLTERVSPPPTSSSRPGN